MTTFEPCVIVGVVASSDSRLFITNTGGPTTTPTGFSLNTQILAHLPPNSAVQGFVNWDPNQAGFLQLVQLILAVDNNGAVSLFASPADAQQWLNGAGATWRSQVAAHAVVGLKFSVP